MIDTTRLTNNERHVIVAALSSYDRKLIDDLDRARSDAKRAAVEWQHYQCQVLMAELAGK